MDQRAALAKLQETELEILLMLDAFCAQHGVTWFMDSGTALGAMRHSGFIPWDDDIDIGMLREEYDRFVDLARDGLPEGYSLHTFEDTDGCATLFAKVCKDGTRFETQETREAGYAQGIFVDVFPYDALARDASARRRQLRNADTWRYLSYLYHSGTIVVPHKGVLGGAERAACRIAHCFVHALVRREDIPEKFARSIIRGEGASDEFIILAWTNMAPCTPDVLLPPSQAEFCGHMLPIAAKPDEHLTNMYGDWRKVPEPEDRRTHLPLLLDFGDGTSWQAC